VASAAAAATEAVGEAAMALARVLGSIWEMRGASGSERREEGEERRSRRVGFMGAGAGRREGRAIDWSDWALRCWLTNLEAGSTCWDWTELDSNVHTWAASKEI
jgi:hypothetical protein